MPDDVRYSETDEEGLAASADSADERFDVDEDASKQLVLDEGTYENDPPELTVQVFDIAHKQVTPQRGANAGVPVPYIDIAIEVIDEKGMKYFVHSGAFGPRNCQTGKNTGSSWPRFAKQLGIAGQKKSDIEFPIPARITVGVREYESAIEGTDEKVKRRENTLVDVQRMG